VIAVVCDSNVYVSALVFGGTPREVVALGETGRIQLVASATLVSEVERVLVRKFQWEGHRVQRFCGPLWDTCRFVEPVTKVKLCRDPKDDHLLALAADGHAGYLITGDNDLLAVGGFQVVRILSPANFWHEKPWVSRNRAQVLRRGHLPPSAAACVFSQWRRAGGTGTGDRGTGSADRRNYAACVGRSS
jgi:putative PIN family toxin of toxin-antitoxin system